MKKHDTKKVREAIGAMDGLDVDAPEILRRLREDECGIGYPVDISQRAVYYHRTKIREEKRRDELQLGDLGSSINAMKQRTVDLLARELVTLEGITPGKMTVVQVPLVERIHKALAHMERDERRSKRGTKAGEVPAAPAEQPETAIEKVAREERERSAIALSVDDSQTSPTFIPAPLD